LASDHAPISDSLVRRLQAARYVVVLTGAGMSAESGVPTFRDAQEGLWSRYRPEQLATPEAFAADPALVWGWYEWRRHLALAVRPHAGHRALVELARRVPRFALFTQNVDDLHEQAGLAAVVHLHGSLHAPRCATCGRAADVASLPPAPAREPGPMEPPRCVACGGRLRPGVVWFGEPLPAGALQAAQQAAAGCDLFLSVGTSSLVYPAAGLPGVAGRAGACVVQVNPAPTALDAVADFNLAGPAGTLLPRLVAAAWGSTGGAGAG
jgi:NAD-dependent deacetylase